MKYSTIEKELLAVLWATKHFRPYLYGNKFIIYTDHRPLAWLYSLQEPNSKLTRWRLRLQEYDFEIYYKKGWQNTNADALSRIKINNINEDKEETEEDQPQNDIASLFNEEFETVVISDSDSDVSVHTDTDKVEKIARTDEPVDLKPRQILVYTWYKNSICVNDISENKQCIIEVVLPINNSKLIKQFLKENVNIKNKYNIYFEHEQHRKDFTKVINQMYKEKSSQFIECTERILCLTDEGDQNTVVSKYHIGKTCHRGINETYQKI